MTHNIPFKREVKGVLPREASAASGGFVQRFLAVTDESTTFRPLDIAAYEAETGEKAALVGPFIRVRQITEPIAELQATANREDTVELRWRSAASGTWSTLSLPDRGRKSAYEVLRSRDGVAIAK